jgi:hypothetical protein
MSYKIAILIRGKIKREIGRNGNFIKPFYYKKTIQSFYDNILKIFDEDINIIYDIYGSIKGSDNPMENEEFISDIKFKKCIFNYETNLQFDDYLGGLKLIKNSNEKYNLIIVTRIDLLYKINIKFWNIKLSKFNFLWNEPIGPEWFCDVIHIFNNSYLDDFIEILENDKKEFENYTYGQRQLPFNIIRKIGPYNINILFKEKYFSGTQWNIFFCNNPIYIIYGYPYPFGNIYD